jgi:hypothetical protein
MVIGAALVLVALLWPSALGAAAPLLMAAVCPVGMLMMVRGCRRPTASAQSAGADAELAQLRSELADLRADADADEGAGRDGRR